MRIGTVASIIVLAASVGSARAQDTDCGNEASTVEINACLERLLGREDAALNRVFQQAIRSIGGTDSMAPADRRQWEAALRDAQRKWIAFRDADCKGVVGYEWFGGTGASGAVMGCLVEKTRARTKDLTERYVNR